MAGEPDDVVGSGSGLADDDGRGDEVAGGEFSRSELVGTAWDLVAGSPMVEGYPVTLSFEADWLGGSDGCNGFGLAFNTGDGLLVATDSGESGSRTEVGCEPAVLEAGDAYFDALMVVDGVVLDGEELVLTGDGVELRFTRQPGFDFGLLVDRTWTLESLGFDDELNPAVGSSGYVRFNGDGSFEGSTGCRSLTGAWVAGTGPNLHFTNLGADGSCAPELVDQDNTVISVLEGPRLHFGETSLTLSSPPGDFIVFQPAVTDDPPPDPQS